MSKSLKLRHIVLLQMTMTLKLVIQLKLNSKIIFLIHTLIILASNNSNQEIESPKLSEGEEKRIKKARTKKTESVIIRAVLILLIVLMIVALILLSSDV